MSWGGRSASCGPENREEPRTRAPAARAVARADAPNATLMITIAAGAAAPSAGRVAAEQDQVLPEQRGFRPPARAKPERRPAATGAGRRRVPSLAPFGAERRVFEHRVGLEHPPVVSASRPSAGAAVAANARPESDTTGATIAANGHRPIATGCPRRQLHQPVDGTRRTQPPQLHRVQDNRTTMSADAAAIRPTAATLEAAAAGRCLNRGAVRLMPMSAAGASRT